jgi:GNAT superfamily N-acetyltransferase
MQITPFERADLPYVAAISPDGWGDITPAFLTNLNASFCHPIKSVVDGKLVGVGNTIENEDTVWLAQIIVDPAYRNRGIGLAITNALVDNVDRSRFKTIMLDATHFGFPVYQKAGFEVVGEHMHFTGSPIIFNINMEHIIPYEEKYASQVYTLDRMASGEGRRNSLTGFLDGSLLYVSGEKVTGVYFATAAKGLIIASDPASGVELMKCRLTARDTCMLPAANKAGVDFLLQNGFKYERTSHRMRLGPQPSWNPTYIYNCMSGALG